MELFNIQEVKNCPNEAPVSTLYYTLSQYNQTAKIDTANITLDRDYGDDLLLEVDVKRWNEEDSAYSITALQLQTDKPCTKMFNLFGDIARRMFLSAGRPIGCPFKKGIVHFAPAYPDMSGIPFIVTYGRYLIQLKVRDPADDNVLLICVQAILNVGPEEQTSSDSMSGIDDI